MPKAHKRMEMMENTSFKGIVNGTQGPSYFWQAVELANSAYRWPIWTETLEGTNPLRLAEGGKRIRGEVKTGNQDALLVSYITVVRNNVRCLPRAIHSVCQQSYPNVEHIVVDGASTDGTLDIIKKSDSIDYYVSEPDKGLYDAINKAVPLARGELICILNSDDWLEPTAAEIAVRVLTGVQGKALLASGAIVHYPHGKKSIWTPSLVHPGSYFTCANDCHNAIYATKEVYEATGPYDSSYKIAADFKWIMKCSEVGSKFYYTKETSINYSIGGVSSDARLHSLECIQVVLEKFPFLSEEEAQGLYWCFFCFINTSGPKMVFPALDDHTGFLKDIICKHSDKQDFIQAIAWASINIFNHPFDAYGFVPSRTSFKSCLVKSIQALLCFSPTLYDFARVQYQRFFKT